MGFRSAGRLSPYFTKVCCLATQVGVSDGETGANDGLLMIWEGNLDANDDKANRIVGYVVVRRLL